MGVVIPLRPRLQVVQEYLEETEGMEEAFLAEWAREYYEAEADAFHAEWLRDVNAADRGERLRDGD